MSYQEFKAKMTELFAQKYNLPKQRVEKILSRNESAIEQVYPLEWDMPASFNALEERVQL